MILVERMMLAHNAMHGWRRDAWSYRPPLSTATIAAIVGGFVPIGLWWCARKSGKQSKGGK